MNIILIRHAIAENREVFSETGQPDELRPLTSRGRKKFSKTISSIKSEIPELDEIVFSPLTRCQETSQLLHKIFPQAKLISQKKLIPGIPPEEMIDWLSKKSGQLNIALIGHEPDLGKLGTYALTGKKTPLFRLRKGGICVLHFTDHIDKAKAELKCLLQPSILKSIKK